MDFQEILEVLDTQLPVNEQAFFRSSQSFSLSITGGSASLQGKSLGSSCGEMAFPLGGLACLQAPLAVPRTIGLLRFCLVPSLGFSQYQGPKMLD